MGNIKELSGLRFGKWVVIDFAYLKNQRAFWTCKCDCGTFRVVAGNTLTKGGSQSCGCTYMRYGPNGVTYHTDTEIIPPRMRSYYTSYKHNARIREYSFELNEIEFAYIVMQDCHYCGAKPSMRSIRRCKPIVANGIDRVDNAIGYTRTNSVACCTACNRAKLQMSAQEYIDHCKKVSEYNANRY